MLCLTMPCDWFNIVEKCIDFNYLLLAKVVAMYTTILIIRTISLPYTDFSMCFILSDD